MKKLPKIVNRHFLINSFIILAALVTLISIGLYVSPNSAKATWFNDNWAYRKIIPITANTGDDTASYVAVTLADTDDLVTAGQLQSDCGDLRFTKQNGDILPYYISSGCNSASTVVHVYFDTLPAGASDFYFYYGNPSTVNGFSTTAFSTAAVSVTVGTIGSAEKSPSPVLYWKLDDNTVGTAEDSTTNALDGTHNNTPTIKSEDLCVAGKCLFFDGANNENVSLADNDKVDFNTGAHFTVSAWIKKTGAASANSVILQKSSANIGSTYTGYKLYMDASGDLCFAIQDGTGAVDSACTSAVDFDDDSWHFVSGVKNEDLSITLYVDGVQRAQDASLASQEDLSNSTALRIGVDSDGTSNDFLGYIDEVRIYRDNTARTATQILADYNARSNPEGVSASLGSNTPNNNALSDGLVGYWKMDDSGVDAEGESSTDSSGNSNTGTLYGDNSTGDNGTGMDCTSSGKFGSGCNLDGTDDYVDLSNPSSITSTETGTISMWVNLTSNTGEEFISYGGGAAGNAGQIGIVYSNGTIFITQASNGGTGAGQLWAVKTLTAGTWYHLVLTSDGSTYRFYVDGQELPIAGNGTNNGNWFADTTLSGTIRISLGALYTNGSFSNYLNGSLDEARIYNRALSPAEVSQLYNWAPGPVGYWKLDDKTGTSAIDSSGNGNNATLDSSTQWTNGKYGGAASFDGTQSLVTTNGNSVKGLSQTTIEMWFNPSQVDGTQRSMYVECTTADCRARLQIDIYSTGLVFGGRTPDDVSYTVFHSDGRALSANTWYHLAAVFDSVTDTHYIYLNGIPKSTATTTSSFTTTNPVQVPRFGHNWSGSTANYQGILDEVKIYNYARTSAQILEDMNAGHPAPGSPVSSSVAHWKLDEGYGTSAQDYSGNSNTLTLSSATSAWTNSGKFNKAWNGDGALYMSKADDSDFDVSATDDYAISLWYKSDSASNPGATEYLFNKASASIAGYAIYANTSGNLCFAIDDDTTWSPDVASCTTTDVYDATWHHIVAVRDVTQDKTYIYLDGNLADSDTDSTSATLANSLSLYVGDRDGTNNGDEFNGDLDEIKVYRSALTAEQVKLDMNRSSSQVLGAVGASSNQQPQSAANEYCPPDSSATACTGPVGEWKFDEGTGTTANDSSGNANTGTLTSGPTWTNGKFNKAVRFDGTDDYIPTTYTGALTDFTICAWFKDNTAVNAQYERIVDKNYTNGFWLGKNNSSNTSWGGGVSESSAPYGRFVTLPAGQWNHICSIRNGTTHTIIGNGSVSTTGTVSGSAIATSALTFGNVFGNNDANGLFSGEIDQVRLYNYARTQAQVAWEYNKGLPVGHWRMDECQGTIINDVSGNSLTGTLTIGASGTNTTVGTCQTSGAWYDGATGKRNYSMDFDDTDDYISIAANSIFGITTDISLSAWIKRGSTSNYGGIIAKTDGAGSAYDYDLGICSSSSGCSGGGVNNDKLFFYSDDTTPTQVFSSTAITDTSSWHHLVFVRSGSTYYFYLDGKLDSTGSLSGAFANNNYGIFIGTDEIFSTSFFNGGIDDTRIYNYPLTATQIKTLYNEGATRFGPTTGAP